MTTTVPASTALDEVAVERYQHLLATKTYEQLHILAGDLAYIAAFHQDGPTRALAYARLPLVHAAADRRPEGRNAERARMVWCLRADLERPHHARNWLLAEVPTAGGTPFWDQHVIKHTPALAYEVFRSLATRATANRHRLVLQEAGK